MTNLSTLTVEQGGGQWDDVPADLVFDGVSPSRGTGNFSKDTLANELHNVMFPFSGTYTWLGSGATAAVTVTGVAATDIVIATIRVPSTQAASLLKATPTTNTITFGLSAANTSNDCQISYLVLRP